MGSARAPRPDDALIESAHGHSQSAHGSCAHVGDLGSVAIRRVAVAALLVVLCVPLHVRATPRTARSLPPESADVISRVVRRLAPALTLQSAAIDRDHALVTLCPSNATSNPCFVARLDDPLPGCDGDLAGAWCVTYPTIVPSTTARSAVRDAFANDSSQVWNDPQTSPTAAPVIEFSQHTGSWSRVLAISLALLFAPMLVGLLLGIAITRFRKRRIDSPAWIAIGPAVVVFTILILPPRFRWLGLWDTLAESLFAVFVLLCAAHSAFADRRRIALLAASVLLTCVFGECVTRVALPRPPSFPPASEARVVLGNSRYRANAFSGGQEAVCNLLFGRGWSSHDDSETLRLPDAYRPAQPFAHHVLYLGDSMTAGVGGPSSEAFPAQIQRSDPTTEHVNGAISAIGPDGYFLLLGHWLDRLTPDLVVMNLFVGNDLTDIDRPYPCCDGGPILRYDAPRPRPRCETPNTITARLGLASYVHVSPAPYFLRVMTGVSSLAAYATAAFQRIGGSPAFRDGASHAGPATYENAYRHLETILRATRDELARRHVAFIVTTLPVRSELEASARDGSPQPAIEGRIASVARDLGVDVFDAWPVLLDAVRTRGSDALFVDRIHFSSAGNALVGAWLLEHVNASRTH